MNSLQSASSVNRASGAWSVTVGRVPTPLGDFHAVFTPRGLAQLTFPSRGGALEETRVGRFMPDARVTSESPELEDLGRQLTDYLRGRLREFHVRLDLRGTPFQLAVWNALLEIGYSQVRSYGDVARAIGRPQAVRAVGAANGLNPVPIIVPCHRVIGSNGTLTGYGGGIELKHDLLALEGAML